MEFMVLGFFSNKLLCCIIQREREREREMVVGLYVSLTSVDETG
jgi:hypothetical protein